MDNADIRFPWAKHFSDDGAPSRSSMEQADTEKLIDRTRSQNKTEINDLTLFRERHCLFLLKGLERLSTNYECLEASRTWICYWILHSLELLGFNIDFDLARRVSNFIKSCQSTTGGFGGGPYQDAHLATTYAAVNALVCLGTDHAFEVINRKALNDFIFRMRKEDGSFKMHTDGESDIRSSYCALAVASLCNLDMAVLFKGTAEWMIRCQTYEGGFGGRPGVEAHGGYTFCGVAGLSILQREELVNFDSLGRYLANRQTSFEGGFQGRTNKLVDSCYSFWQSGSFPIVHYSLSIHSPAPAALSPDKWLFHQEALQSYLLICCQHKSGGLIDKPAKSRDFYHTCYALSGLSAAQNVIYGNANSTHVVGKESNEIRSVHPVFNLTFKKFSSAHRYFNALPKPAVVQAAARKT